MWLSRFVLRDPNELTWHVLLCEPNREHTAARHLKHLGCESYLPIFARAHRQKVGGGRRWRVYRRPLFPGYLFVRPTEKLWFFARIAMGVRRMACPFLSHDGRLAEVATGKLEEIQVLERTINSKRSERMKFRLGDRVLVSEGAFTGMKATVHMLTDRARVELLLDFLGQKAKVELAEDQIQAA
jgi:transcriptional antiterminator RfaH